MKRAHVAPIVEEMQRLSSFEAELHDAEELISAETDPEMIEMAKEELKYT